MFCHGQRVLSSPKILIPFFIPMGFTTEKQVSPAQGVEHLQNCHMQVRKERDRATAKENLIKSCPRAR